ncbi:patatin-like phospholipase family protein [Parablautia sp. Marseille-Q6255]|uniref:patatin-like phospholipase family protein n=1 Tax=Parablautia sp. Marseille-Q6255 TaxID=3039593 RepID=UPI0024BD11BF|nr:patatin family protein [Parablautia sp. Marseille-Q6255]
MTTGLLLEGGAMRGMYTAGVLDVLMQNKIPIDGIIGVSAGALFGMNYKSKQIGRVLRYNRKYAANKDYIGFHSLLTTGNIMNEEFCFHKLVTDLDPVDFEAYRNAKEDFYAVVTNMNTGKAEYIRLDDLEKEDQLEYLRASGSMPFLSRPVSINGQLYLDGGIADSIPIDRLLRMNYEKIIVVLTRPRDYRKKKSPAMLPKLYYRKYPRLVSAINSRYKTYNKQLEQVLELEAAGRIFVFRPSRYVPIRRIERNVAKIQEMYDLGKTDALERKNALLHYLS